MIAINKSLMLLRVRNQMVFRLFSTSISNKPKPDLTRLKAAMSKI
jgi:hypothetical protein